MKAIPVPTSLGDLIDRITILEIKRERIGHPEKLKNVSRELSLLQEALFTAMPRTEQLLRLTSELRALNTRLWELEDQLHERERSQCFDADFVAMARDTYRTNDARAAAKRAINLMYNSELVEEKSYPV